MDIILSNSSELPFYQQIKNQIKQAILKGTLQEGDLLPSIRNLADDLGKGTFVAMANSELIMESKRHMIETKLQQVVVEAKTFDIPKREIIEIIELLFEEDL